MSIRISFCNDFINDTMLPWHLYHPNSLPASHNSTHSPEETHSKAWGAESQVPVMVSSLECLAKKHQKTWGFFGGVMCVTASTLCLLWWYWCLQPRYQMPFPKHTLHSSIRQGLPGECYGMFTGPIFWEIPPKKREQKGITICVHTKFQCWHWNMNMLKRCEAKLPRPSLQLLGWRVVAGRSRLRGWRCSPNTTTGEQNPEQLGKGWANLMKENGICKPCQLDLFGWLWKGYLSPWEPILSTDVFWKVSFMDNPDTKPWKSMIWYTIPKNFSHETWCFPKGMSSWKHGDVFGDVFATPWVLHSRSWPKICLRWFSMCTQTIQNYVARKGWTHI